MVPQVIGHPKVMSMRFCPKISSFLGLLAGWVLSLFGKSPPKPVSDDLRRADFKTSTQHLGVRFSEKIRDVFRFRWLKIADKTDARYSERKEESRPCE
ncbi:hypothetical protein ACFL3Q_10890 [Planctomycetota bacterium]